MVSRTSATVGHHPAPRLYLVSPAITEGSGISRVLPEVLSAGEVAAMLLRLAAGTERELMNRVKAIAPIAQERGVAVLLDGHPGLVARAGADGAHLTGLTALQEALDALKPARIAGVGGLRTRHDAMVAGEAGADYLMFGEPDASGRRPAFAAIVERVAWWGEIFEPPCVGYAGSLAEVAPLAAAGTDFVALGDWLWSTEAGPARTIAAASRHLAAAEQVS